MQPPICARHGKPVRNTQLATFFLCDDCCEELSRLACRGEPPVFREFDLIGFCGLCNESRCVKLTQWYLCEDCQRVINSYRLGRVAAEYALQQWDTLVTPSVPHIYLKQVDIVQPQQYERRRKREPAKQLDFLAVERASYQPLFWLELKTGRNALSDMRTFQLDKSDCDDVLNVVKVTGLPALLCHVCVAQEFQPPTSRFIGAGIWWTDIFAMRDSFIEIRRRRFDSGKEAAHFAPTCFRELNVLAKMLSQGYHFALQWRLAREGIPKLYRETKR
jgi:hypothetical protein